MYNLKFLIVHFDNSLFCSSLSMFWYTSRWFWWVYNPF